MQNLRVKRDLPQKYFTTPVTAPFFSLYVGLTALVLLIASPPTAHAQVTPGTLPTAPGSGRSGTTQSPATTNPAAGRGSTMQPGNLPAGVQQQIQNRTGGQLPGQNVGTGRTTAQPTNQPATNNGQPALNRTNANANPNNPRQVDDQGNPIPDTTQQVVETGYEAARRQEREEKRRKLFGYALFNDPTLAPTFQPNLTIATPRNYIVGPGDQLNIRIYGFSEVDFSQSVSPEGNVYIGQATGVGPIFVSGLTVEQARGRIESRLATKFAGLRSGPYGPKNTFLELSVGNLRSIRVTVTGEAVRPGTYSVPSLSTALNVIYQAGGPNELGSFRKVQLIRNNRVAATLDLYDFLLNGTQRNDLRLQDNDNIRFQTFQTQVEITGTVKRNNIFEMLPGETLDRLLFYAGDFAANAYKNRVKVTRLTDRERKVIDVTMAEFKTFAMQDGDLTTVDPLLDRFENQITIEGAVYRPGQYSLDQNKTLKQLIQTAEGLKGDAFQGRVLIVRTREDLAIENITVNVGNILAGRDPDVTLQREDQIIVTSAFDLAEIARISVQGEVNQPTEDINYMANMTLNDALLRAGGLKESAAASQVEVVRRKKDVDPQSKSAQLAEVFRFNVNRDLSTSSEESSRFVLQPFDQIIVRRSPNYFVQTYANVEGEVIVPGSYPIQRKDQKVSDLVGLAGGLTPQAYPQGATLIRRVTLSADELARQQRAVTELADDANRAAVETEVQAVDKPESIDINLTAILSRPGSAEDILVQEGDILRIPKLLETVRVQGEVLLPKTVKYRGGHSFMDYIADTGGFTSKSQRRKTFVVYANGSVDRTRKFMFFNLYPRVEPGSEVVVPRKTTSPLTPTQILGSATGIASSLITLIVTVLALSRVGN